MTDIEKTNQKEHADLYKRSIKGGYWVFAIRLATQAMGFVKSIIVFNFLFNQNLELIIVANLLMAGRNISVTHVALGTVRVQKTTGMMGEVVGMAASLAAKHKTSPRGVYEEHLAELIKWSVAFIIMVRKLNNKLPVNSRIIDTLYRVISRDYNFGRFSKGSVHFIFIFLLYRYAFS